MKQPFKFQTFTPSPVLKLCEIERILRNKPHHPLISPVPSRRTLINWIEDGTLDGKRTAKNFYVVTVESFERLISNFQVKD